MGILKEIFNLPCCIDSVFKDVFFVRKDGIAKKKALFRKILNKKTCPMGTESVNV